MLRKVAAVGMLALCCSATGCWFNAPCCSPYDKAGPTFGDDPSVPDDFNYRKGSILGSDTTAGGQYIDDGVEYMPNGAKQVPDSAKRHPDSAAYAPDNADYTADDADYTPNDEDYVPDGGMLVEYVDELPQQEPAQYAPQDEPQQYVPQQEPVQYTPQPQPAVQSVPRPRRFPGLFRAAFSMNRGATFQGMRDQDGGNQDTAHQGADYPRSGYQGASTYRTGTNPRYRSQRINRDLDRDETEE